MTRLKRIPPSAIVALVVVVGFACALAGLFLLAELVRDGAGAAVALLAGGLVLVAGGLVVDVD